jgi:hypothetical protein
LEEIGKYVLLEEAAKADSGWALEISVRDFKNHDLKCEKGKARLKEWGIDLGQTGIQLTKRTREDLWYVNWDDATQELKRTFSSLDPYAISKTAALGELLREGLVKMNQLRYTPGVTNK